LPGHAGEGGLNSGNGRRIQSVEVLFRDALPCVIAGPSALDPSVR
jgi:hypothetical protein